MSALHSASAPLSTIPADDVAASPRVNTRRADFIEEDYFGPQHTSASVLPEPKPLAENLARCVLEILAGARDLDQISRWVTDDVYRSLMTRVHGVAECCVILHGKARSRSIAIRLEGLDGRWRATAIHVL